jgi:RecG-like helicase
MGLLRRPDHGPHQGRGPDGVAAGRAKAILGEVPGCEAIGDCRARSRGRVAGIVESIKLVPRPDTIRLEITISDGTGEISGVWFGHHRIGGLDLGERVMFEGTVGSPAPGKLEILHPTYQLLGRPGDNGSRG